MPTRDLNHWRFSSTRVISAIGVPQTYPPRPVNGLMVTDFLTPSQEVQWTHPPELKQEITARFGPYMFDVPNFRTDDKARLRDDLFRMTEQRFAVGIGGVSVFRMIGTTGTAMFGFRKCSGRNVA